ncbi:hypothetical protein FHG87_017436 [Trinorchestia longiramus]|nr:hypothetical protein FHG87_017436 [Trinorchestia longiramus]
MSASLLVILVLVVQSGSAIRCWDCNSKFDPRCSHEHFDNHTLETVDCDQESLPHMPQLKAQYCRKIIQYNRRAEEVGGCYSRTGTKDIIVTFCSCNHDACNSAPHQVAPVPAVGVTLLMLSCLSALI